MLHQTKGIVLRTIKYGETSIVVNIFTELFGIQSYLVNGVRASSKKGTGKANRTNSRYQRKCVGLLERGTKNSARFADNPRAQ